MAEYDRIQKKQESRAVANNCGRNKQFSKKCNVQFGSNIFQRSLNFDTNTEYLKKENVDIAFYKEIQDKAEKKYIGSNKVEFGEGTPKVGLACFTKDDNALSTFDRHEGIITVQPISAEEKTAKTSKNYNDRLIQVSHETNHAIDYIVGKCRDLNTLEKIIISELNSYATHAALTTQIKEKHGTFSDRFEEDESIFKDGKAIESDRLRDTISSYLAVYKVSISPTDYIHAHTDDIINAQNLYNELTQKKE